jgi:spoIIIJ-associated protein
MSDHDQVDEGLGEHDADEEQFEPSNGAEADDADSADSEGQQAGDSGAEDRDDSRRRRRRPRETPDAEPQDERARQALDFVSRVVNEMEMSCRVKLSRNKASDENDDINIEITGNDAGRIIGKKGQVLMALQFLTHRVVNRPGLERRHILVDAEGYRSRRDSSLASMARRLGRQAVEQGKIITFEPMNPRDRRVVHLALAKFEGVITKSDGEGDDRRVQIIPVRR